MTAAHNLLWRWMDRPGHEAARLQQAGGEWHLRGTSVLLHEGAPCRLDYLVVCDVAWRTLGARVEGWIGAEPVAAEIAVDGDRWLLNGVEAAQVAGAIDIDLNFSPSTNLLPIRRLGLRIGEEARVRAAWLRFPAFGLEPLDQVYRRTGERTWRYSSADGAFVRDLEVDEAGFVTRYPGFWEAVGG
jgi:hypothetical protein